jgi:hypothetical protein
LRDERWEAESMEEKADLRDERWEADSMEKKADLRWEADSMEKKADLRDERQGEGQLRKWEWWDKFKVRKYAIYTSFFFQEIA